MYVGDYSKETFMYLIVRCTFNAKHYVHDIYFRAGYKLEAAIEQLEIDVSGKIALDSGLSTGGFTDCLLQNGASFVYGVDVGYGQVFFKPF